MQLAPVDVGEPDQQRAVELLDHPHERRSVGQRLRLRQLRRAGNGHRISGGHQLLQTRGQLTHRARHGGTGRTVGPTGRIDVRQRPAEHVSSSAASNTCSILRCWTDNFEHLWTGRRRPRETPLTDPQRHPWKESRC
jgi:hypothetical protein